MLRKGHILAIFVIVVSVITFAQASEHTEITVTIIGEPIIEIEENFLIRANVEIVNYDPRDGYYFMKVVDTSTGKVLRESEILPHYIGNDIWGVQVAYMTKENDLEVGEYGIIISTEFGTATASTTLSVVETITQPEQQEVKEAEKITQTSVRQSKTFIPDWVKQVAEFWVADQIDDSGFAQVIEYLVQKEIITIPYAEAPEGETAIGIPIWIKTTAEFWVNGDVSDDEFATALEWLINNGIIRV